MHLAHPEYTRQKSSNNNNPFNVIIHREKSNGFLVHSSNKLVDKSLPVSMVTTLNVMPGLLSIATTSVTQLERPEEVVGLLEVRTNRHYLVNQVLNTYDPVFAKAL